MKEHAAIPDVDGFAEESKKLVTNEPQHFLEPRGFLYSEVVCLEPFLSYANACYNSGQVTCHTITQLRPDCKKKMPPPG